ncbi:MAG: VWA domain-containing protein [Actinomycetota bacterium]
MAGEEGLRTVEALVGFGRELRAAGLPVGTGRVLTFIRAAAALGSTGVDDLYWAGRATLIAHPGDVGVFDRVFAGWVRQIDDPHGGEDLSGLTAEELTRADALDAAEIVRAGMGADDSPRADGDSSGLGLVASGMEVLRHKAFSQLTPEERRLVERAIRRLVIRAPLEHTRRRRPAHRGDRFDLRRTLRASLRTQGEPFDRRWRTRRTRARPLMLILDISGSMAPYSRALIQFGYAAMAAGRRVEVFCFGTRLTRVTRTLRTNDPDRAMERIGEQVADWEGGTRIGESLKSLVDGWSQRAALRGAVVVLCSDGLERGDPELLRHQMARLHRLAHRVIWANPLKGSPRYEPLARGMAAALPSVDEFVSGHDLESVEALAAVLAR